MKDANSNENDKSDSTNNSKMNGYDSDNSTDEIKSPIKEKKIQHIDEPINENMSLTELQKIAKEKNIAITVVIDGKKKIKNKKDLCKEILEKI